AVGRCAPPSPEVRGAPPRSAGHPSLLLGPVGIPPGSGRPNGSGSPVTASATTGARAYREFRWGVAHGCILAPTRRPGPAACLLVPDPAKSPVGRQNRRAESDRVLPDARGESIVLSGALGFEKA